MGSIIIGRVTKITPRDASVEIVCVGEVPVRDSFVGLLRKSDVRATEVDRVEMHESYLPGDVVRAAVISLGDSRSYLLSTARPELGVMQAKSEAGHPMVALSHSEMQCPVTLSRERRKVARPE